MSGRQYVHLNLIIKRDCFWLKRFFCDNLSGDVTFFFKYSGKDSSLRVFDIENGMMVLEPMEEMECDSLEREGDYLFARCGEGAALIIFRYQEGDEELIEEDFIHLGADE